MLPRIAVLLCLSSLLFAQEPQPQQASPPAARMVDLPAPDGTVLKASYFAAAKPGPGVLLFHQSNRTRASWDDLASRLAAAGINTLTVDERGHGETGGKSDRQKQSGDLDTAFQYLVSQPGVDRNVIGAGGAGWLGVDNSVETARRHTAEVKSLALLSGETVRPGLEFLRQASQLPELFVMDDNDEYPPTIEAMHLLYSMASNPGKKLVHYSASHDAPWLWYETSDASRVPAHGAHGTDMSQTHPELPGMIVDWFVTTLIKTPGHAPADPLAAAAVLNQLETPGGAAQVTHQLMEARKRDPQAQLFPEITASIIGQDYMRAGDPKNAIEVLQLVLMAYSDSADAHETLGEAYLQDGQRDLAQHHAQEALALLDIHGMPASSWADTEPRRGEIRSGAQDVLKQIATAPISRNGGLFYVPGSLFRDCPDCPEMVIITPGSFTMGSSAEEKAWAASHGGNLPSVADEAPQHRVSLKTFALGKYDVTRGEYAAFVRETRYPAGDGCYETGNPDSPKHAEANWEHPGFLQSDRDPVVCVSWQDARAYVSWLNSKLRKANSTSGEGPYRLPTEAEWEYAARAGTTTRFWWGDEADAAAAHAWFKDNSGAQTHSVGMKPANPFGLYDMSGNVWQWTEDCYADDYANAPRDGSAAQGAGNCLRSDRGGSWFYPAWLLRPATRERNPAGYRDGVLGFRLARTLP
jgi:formylglycine-generating enzyme required for sulfatase activity/dienelactone hydrolase